MACKLGGTGSEGITRAGQRVTARLIETQIWHTPASSVALWGEGSEKEKWPTVLYGRKLSPSSHLDARYFGSSPYATGPGVVSRTIFSSV